MTEGKELGHCIPGCLDYQFDDDFYLAEGCWKNVKCQWQELSFPIFICIQIMAQLREEKISVYEFPSDEVFFQLFSFHRTLKSEFESPIYHLLFLSDVLDFNNLTESSGSLNQLNNEEFITSLLNTVIKHVKVIKNT